MPRKKRSAWGALTQVDATTWRIRFWASGPDGYRRRSKTIRGTRLDAERARSELMLAHSEDAPCPTVGEVWDRWMLPDLERRAEAGDVAATTITQYRYGWQRHVAPVWAHVQCDAVRPLAVQQWLYGITANAAKQGILLLRMALDYAVRYELIEHNPCRERYVMPSKSTVERRDAGVWTERAPRRRARGGGGEPIPGSLRTTFPGPAPPATLCGVRRHTPSPPRRSRPPSPRA